MIVRLRAGRRSADMYRIMLAITVVGLVFMAGGLTGPALQADSDGMDMEAAKTTFESYCSKCHATSRPLGKMKDRAGWESTVNRMSGYHKKFGAVIPEEDRNTIIDYLVNVAGK
jgi:hypothetical protein